jgi:hypothetical protein
MSMWYRVFGSDDSEPAPAAVLDHVRTLGAAVKADFSGDDAGWYAAELDVGGATLHLERFGAAEEGIRAELNSWAAWLETCDHSPHSVPLMEKMIQTRQLFTLRRSDDGTDVEGVGRVCVGLCRFLAAATKGVWQADGAGLFDARGTLLVEERGRP